MRANNIDSLVADLAPVRRVRARDCVTIVLGATALAVLAVLLRYGIRPDIAAGAPHPMVVLRAGMLVLLGLATTLATVSAARPAVGQGQNGWIWALAAATLMPLTAALLFIYHKITGLPFGTGGAM